MDMRTRLFEGAKSLALCAVLSTPAVWAAQPEQMAKDAGCLSCHSISEKVVGPSFKSVAEKYRGQSDAVNQLVQSVRNGSKGTWGRIPMPAHNALAEADVKTIVEWVLAR